MMAALANGDMASSGANRGSQYRAGKQEGNGREMYHPDLKSKGSLRRALPLQGQASGERSRGIEQSRSPRLRTLDISFTVKR